MKDKLTGLGRAERYPLNAHGDGTKGNQREFNHRYFQTIFKRSHACVSDINPVFFGRDSFFEVLFSGGETVHERGSRDRFRSNGRRYKGVGDICLGEVLGSLEVKEA